MDENADLKQLILQGKVTPQEAVDILVEKENKFTPLMHKMGWRDLKIETVPCGFKQLDDLKLLKKNRPELIVVAGRPSHGKSVFLFQLAMNTSKINHVAVFSLEMSAEEVNTRLLSIESQVSATLIKNGLVTRDSVEVLDRAVERLQSYHFHLDAGGGVGLSQIRARVLKQHEKEPLSMIVIDYLGLVKSDEGHSRDREIGALTSGLKSLAKEINCPIILACQLNRQVESRIRVALEAEEDISKQRPSLSDLRDSGNIEQDADIVIFVQREFMYNRKRENELDLFIAKNRNGELGDVTFQFFPERTELREISYI